MILPLTIFSSSLKNIRSDPLFSPVPLHSQGQVRMASTVVNADNLSPSLSGSYEAEICSGNAMQHCELFSLAEAKASQLVHGCACEGFPEHQRTRILPRELGAGDS